MSERDRLRALLIAGRTAAAGVRKLLNGIDVVIDPNASADGSAPAPGPSAAGPPPAVPAAVGSPIGRRALAAAAHRPGLAEHLPAGPLPTDSTPAPPPLGAAQRQPDGAHTEPATEGRQGSGPASATGRPPSLTCYPCDGAAVLCRTLGMRGETLPAHGDLEGPATSRDLAWLPLLAGWPHYRTFPLGRLVAVGGYRRAALVRFGGFDAGGARPGGGNRSADGAGTQPVWATLGNDALAAFLPAPDRAPLYLEEPVRLREAIASGLVQQALLGGADLAWAEGLPNCRDVCILSGADAGLDWVPVWGLFSRGATVSWPETVPDAAPHPDADPHIALAPLHTTPGLIAWLNRAVTT